MTAYLKAVVAALSSAVATLVAECADGHITPLRILIAAGTLLATFAAVYFTPNSQPPPPAVEPAPPAEPVIVPAPITADAIAAKAAELKGAVAGAQHELDSFLGAIATAAPPPAPVPVNPFMPPIA